MHALRQFHSSIMRRPIVAANWKLNGSNSMVNSLLTAVDRHAANFASVDVVVCPPFPYLVASASVTQSDNVFLGAQNVSQQKEGAYTGEVSAEMLLEVGCEHVIIGHSERRQYYAENDQTVGAKVERAQQAGLVPVACVGESLQEREQNLMESTIVRQVQAILDAVDNTSITKLVIAYEPIWAIGTGKTASPEQAQEVHALIRAQLTKQSAEAADQIRILYGGSVKPNNAAELFSQADIDGGLIGGASLDADQFNAIVTARRLI